MSEKFVYLFEDNCQDKTIVGGKGQSLALMTSLKLPVPPGFTIRCQTCARYMENHEWPEGLEAQVNAGVEHVEKLLGKKFGDNEHPLLFSVRSGAAISMPGMMDTVLNLGLNDEAVVGLAKSTNNERFALDAYRRFIQMFGDVVMGVPHENFEHIIDAVKEESNIKFDVELTCDNLREVIKRYRAMVKEVKGYEFPTDPREQLRLAINAVFESWVNPRAIKYRELYNIPHDIGTAVNVQAMVFGNTGEDSGTGVGFTRDPATGERMMYGEFLTNAQGEDVVAGIRTPVHLDEMPKLGGAWVEVHKQLQEVYKILEQHYRDMVDMEFTIEHCKLFMLQARAGKRTGAAMVKIAVDLVKEGVLSEEEALMRIEPAKLNELLFPRFDPKHKWESIATGLSASPGAAVGAIVFNADDAAERKKNGEKVILVRRETSPEDLVGMTVSEGILTARGGRTSHAAVVARGMGKCCVAGCSELIIDEQAKTCTIGGHAFKEGDFISLNGTTGGIAAGKVPTVEPSLSGDFGTIMEWAGKYTRLHVRANADIPRDAEVARRFGATGIGLCRTEHMFFDTERIKHMRAMILSNTTEQREQALAKLLPYQEQDFYGLFVAMDSLPVIIRLLDPPLHEFVPHELSEQEVVAKELGLPVQEVINRVHGLAEANPMLGFRGCRLGVIYPEISRMQVRAIMQAAVRATKEGHKVLPEIMIPLVSSDNEMKMLRELADKVAKEVLAEAKLDIHYMIGTMIELPRACVVADKIAENAEFFSFGTNDLHQTTFGISRDDGGKFIPQYLQKGVYAADPFVTIDEEGVGQLMKMAVERGRKTRPTLEAGICGEQGGDPQSIDFCHRINLNYVSCSPYRVPVARVAAAQAAIRNKSQ